MRLNEDVKFDDRLATILGLTVTGEYDRAVRWRQLVDLVARAGPDARGPTVVQAIAEIRAGRNDVATPLRAAAARAIAGRALPLELLKVFAADSLEVAAPLLTGGRPSQVVLEAASPDVRRFLEAMHPADLPGAPPVTSNEPAVGVTLPPLADPPSIREAVARIEQLRSTRASADPASLAAAAGVPPRPRTQVPERLTATTVGSPALFRWECGPGGNIGWVEGAPRGALVGRSIARADADEGVDRDVERAFARRAPFRDATLSLPEAGIVAGRWVISGVPAFAPGDGRFVGYRGVARRIEALAPPLLQTAPGPLDPAALRELVHEMKTPLNAIIGFAEIIDGQYFGPAQSGYRARASEIVGQARVLLVAIDDLDFAARLRSRGSDDSEITDFEQFFTPFANRFTADARDRGVTLAIDAPPHEGLCTLDRQVTERLLQRFTETVLGAAQTGETLRLAVRREDGFCALRLSRPRALEGLSDSVLFESGGEGALDFSLRMVVGLARIIGGRLTSDGNDIVLRMPMAG